MSVFFSAAPKQQPLSVEIVRESSKKNILKNTPFMELLAIKKGTKYSMATLPEGKGKKRTMVLLAKQFDFLTDGESFTATLARELKKQDLSVSIDLFEAGFTAQEETLFAEFLAIGNYSFSFYKSEKVIPKDWYVVLPAGDAEKAQLRSRALTMTRDFVNLWPSDMYPLAFEMEVRKEFQGCSVFSIVGEDLAREGFGGIWAVGKGSKMEPRLVWVEYRGNLKSKTWDYALVGKGVTFDAGGYNIKPTGGMEDMKCDMAGAASVFGVMKYLKDSGAKKNVVGFFPLAENLVSSSAFKPGDVIRMYSGNTVEIANTDAEGRLLLADALAFAEKQYKPKRMLDIATLTGAQLIATGPDITAIMGNNPSLMQDLKRASTQSAEKSWELPLHEPYFRAYESKIADFSNGSWGGRYNPGCIQAGLFLKKFVHKTAWAHLDIAGPAGSFGHADHPLYGYGATGAGVRWLSELILQ